MGGEGEEGSVWYDVRMSADCVGLEAENVWGGTLSWREMDKLYL